MLRSVLVLAALGLAWFAGVSPAVAQKKVALVIGIDAYQSVPKLERAVADSRAMAAALRDLGFRVRAIENASRDAISAGFAAFEDEIDKGDTAFVFFAGHGVEIKGQNLLLPADAPDPNAASEGVLKDKGFLTPALIDRVTDRGARAAFFVIDACRNNPYAQPGARRSIGSTRGLAKVDAPEGVFVLMSAGQNQEALDSLNTRQQPRRDTDRNSIFTRIFLDELGRPGQSHLQLAKNVQTRVRDLAREIGHAQVPAFTDQIIGNVVFREGESRAVAVEPKPAPVPADLLAAVRGDYERAERLNSEAAWVAFLATNPPEPYASFARAARQKLASAIPEGRLQPTAPPTDDQGRLKPPLQFNASRSAAPLSPAEERGLKPQDAFKECAECPEMVVVPAGTYVRGSPDDEESRSKDEGPQRRVTIPRAYAVGKFEVTFSEWDECVLDGGCGGHRPKDEGWGRGRQPVINVSWQEAQAYVAWLARKTGKTYRLLTEAEWEYAARAGTTTPFSFGATISPDEANYDGNYTYGNGRKGVYRQKAIPVGSFRANALGLFDMHGNVWEWVADCYRDSYATASTDGSAFTSSDCSTRVLRGGSWYSNPWDLRSAYRVYYPPVGRSGSIGFRLARTLSP